MYTKIHIRSILILIILISFTGLCALTPTVDSIPMKDGKKLAVDIYIPSGMTKGPVILVQTPYNRLLYRFGLPLGVNLNLNSSNYIFMVADWRGFYGSKKAAYIGSPTIGDDGYSLVEWIAGQTWCNGKIGTWGPSALGRVQFQTALKNPPHLTCICPLVAAPQYEYQEYFPNGDLRTEYVQQLDALGYGMSRTLMAHPFEDATWGVIEAANYYPDSIRVPCFMIGGWYDHTVEFMLPFFNAIRSKSPAGIRDQHRLLMGPWVHGGHGTAKVGSDVQGELTYPNSASWNDSLAILYFDYHLRAVNNGWNSSPYVTYYQMGENKWLNSTAWPPGGTSDVTFYLHSDGTMDNTAPLQNRDSLTFSYDPLNPSPTVGGSTLRSDLQQGPYDQVAKVESRGDILKFTTPVLTKDVVLKGSAVIQLKVSSDKLETDFDVRLTDVYPDGRSMLLKDGVMRMRFRNGTSQASTVMMTQGQIYDCRITLPATSITFLAGHKIRLDITSSNYPRFNRNMNTGGNMYPGNSMDSLVNPVTANNTVHTGKLNASMITLPLVGYGSNISTLHAEREMLELWPNPGTNLLNLNCSALMHEVVAIRIYNATGAMIADGIMSGGKTIINIENLSAGIYMIQAGRYVKTFVKM